MSIPIRPYRMAEMVSVFTISNYLKKEVVERHSSF